MALIKYVVFHPWKAATVLVVGVLLGLLSFYAYQVNAALAVVATEPFDPQAARIAIEAAPPEDTPEVELEYENPVSAVDDDGLSDIINERDAWLNDPRNTHPTSFGDPIDDEIFEAYLLVGTDASGFLADSIILGLQPSDGSAPIMVSLPRDLWVWNLCKDRFSRLNEGLGGCKGLASGPELMALMVEDYTGIPIDHLAKISFTGFAGLVNVMGGISVCVDYPTRDALAHLDIPAGCQRLNGDQALAWVRSRHTEQLKSDTWVQTAGSDFARQRRQQDVLFQLAGSAARVSSPAAMTEALSYVAKSVRLDSGWSFSQAISTGWKYRGIKKASVNRFTVEASGFRTDGGADVLLADVPFSEQLATVYTFPTSGCASVPADRCPLNSEQDQRRVNVSRR